MMRTFVIPAAIILVFLGAAIALAYTAPELQPTSPEPIATT